MLSEQFFHLFFEEIKWKAEILKLELKFII